MTKEALQELWRLIGEPPYVVKTFYVTVGVFGVLLLQVIFGHFANKKNALKVRRLRRYE